MAFKILADVTRNSSNGNVQMKCIALWDAVILGIQKHLKHSTVYRNSEDRMVVHYSKHSNSL